MCCVFLLLSQIVNVLCVLLLSQVVNVFCVFVEQ